MTDSVSKGEGHESAAPDDTMDESVEESAVDAPEEELTDTLTEEAAVEESVPDADVAPPADDADDDDALEKAVAAASDEAEGGDAELVALRQDFQNLNDRHLRLAAEFNNFRRRSEQERLESWSRAQADLVEGFLDVLDDLHRVAELDLGNATVEAIMEGIDLVERKFMRVLSDAGAEVIDPVGEAFDPERMEAMMRVPTESEEDDDTVAMVLQKGYSLKGILVRPARVSVHKHG